MYTAGGGGWSQQHSVADPLGKSRSAIVRRESSPYRSPRHTSSATPPPPPPHCERGRNERGGGGVIQLDIAALSLPADLHNVTVKQLVKALGLSLSLTHSLTLSVCLSVCLFHLVL